MCSSVNVMYWLRERSFVFVPGTLVVGGRSTEPLSIVYRPKSELAGENRWSIRPCPKYSSVGCGDVKRYWPTPPPRFLPFGKGMSPSTGSIDGFNFTEPDGSMPFLAPSSGTDVTPVTPRRSIRTSNAPKRKVL